jgi:homeobox protein cut-like
VAGIDLTNLVSQLDESAADLVENQKEAVVQRKDLAQKTKDFRKLDDEAKLAEFKTLLKAYQQFVDLLTNHGKASSSAFLNLYGTISEAPDPYPLLEASVDSLLVAEETLPKIQAENERLQKSIRDMNSDFETTEARLQEEQKLRKQLEHSREDKAKEIEASWKAVLDEKSDNWEAKERALQEKLDNQERLFNEVKASYEVTQRLGGEDDTNAAAPAMASAAELEIVQSELEKTTHRLAEVESRNEQLRLELAQSSSNATAGNIEDEPSFSRLRSENGKLLRRLEAASFDKDSEARKWESRLRALERDTKSLQEEREELRTKLSQWKDYPELKREVEIFKAIELSTGDDDDDDGTLDGDFKPQGNGSAVSGKGDTLEQMLLARNKKLSNEMATLRVSHQQLQRDLEALQETTSTTNAELERAQSLNATLENDLLTLQQEASNTFPAGAKSVTSRYPTSGTYRTRRSSPTSSIISGFDNSSRSPLDSLSSGEPVGGGSGILPMVQAQRDRFKQKVSQLETELSRQYTTVSSLRQEVASLQKDNLNLYEKTRYVSSYQRSTPSSAPSSSSYPNNPSTVNVIRGDSDTSSGLALERYKSAYESNLSPFAQFRGRESSRAYRRMRLPERAIYSVTRLVLSSRTSRNLFAGYCVALHLLVFVMLYWMHGVDVEKHASNLGDMVGGAVGAGTGAAVGGVRGEAEAHHGSWHEEDFNGSPVQ